MPTWAEVERAARAVDGKKGFAEFLERYMAWGRYSETEIGCFLDTDAGRVNRWRNGEGPGDKVANSCRTVLTRRRDEFEALRKLIKEYNQL